MRPAKQILPLKRPAAEPACIGFDPALYEAWIPWASAVERMPGSVPIFVRRSENAIKESEAALFLDRLTLVYLELATLLADADSRKDGRKQPIGA